MRRPMIWRGEMGFNFYLAARPPFRRADESPACASLRPVPRPGGILAIQEFVRPDKPGGSGQIGALDFYFALTSQAGTWSVREIRSWQEEAGLTTLPPVKFMTGPGVVQQSAFKPGGQPQSKSARRRLIINFALGWWPAARARRMAKPIPAITRTTTPIAPALFERSWLEMVFPGMAGPGSRTVTDLNTLVN